MKPAFLFVKKTTFRLQLQNDFQPINLIWLSLSPDSLTVEIGLLVSIKADDYLRIMPQINLLVNKIFISRSDQGISGILSHTITII